MKAMIGFFCLDVCVCAQVRSILAITIKLKPYEVDEHTHTHNNNNNNNNNKYQELHVGTHQG